MTITFEDRSEVTTIEEYTINEEDFLEYCRGNDITSVSDEEIINYLNDRGIGSDSYHEDNTCTIEAGFYNSDIDSLNELLNEDLDN